LRVELGNPPGKGGSIGDAINWEVLLNENLNLQDIFIISEDKDFCSPMDENEFNPFLLEEWENKNYSNVYFYRSISKFFSENYPNIKLENEREKDQLIQELFTSSTFSKTHTIFAELSKFQEFTEAQKEQIIDAILSNNQIYWIINDEDIKSFIISRMKNDEDALNYEKLLELNELFGDERGKIGL